MHGITGAAVRLDLRQAAHELRFVWKSGNIVADGAPQAGERAVDETFSGCGDTME
jgi:hypothetical protein